MIFSGILAMYAPQFRFTFELSSVHGAVGVRTLVCLLRVDCSGAGARAEPLFRAIRNDTLRRLRAAP